MEVWRLVPECGVCLDVFGLQGDRVARLLSCGHSFCQACLSSLPTDQGVISCPIDREQTLIGDNRVGELKKNFALIDTIERIQNLENSLAVTSTILEKEREIWNDHPGNHLCPPNHNCLSRQGRSRENEGKAVGHITDEILLKIISTSADYPVRNGDIHVRHCTAMDIHGKVVVISMWGKVRAKVQRDGVYHFKGLKIVDWTTYNDGNIEDYHRLSSLRNTTVDKYEYKADVDEEDKNSVFKDLWQGIPIRGTCVEIADFNIYTACMICLRPVPKDREACIHNCLFPTNYSEPKVDKSYFRFSMVLQTVGPAEDVMIFKDIMKMAERFAGVPDKDLEEFLESLLLEKAVVVERVMTKKMNYLAQRLIL